MQQQLYGKIPLEGQQPPKQAIITTERIHEATKTLQEYKAGKTNLEARVTDDELWYKVRHWESIRKNKSPDSPEPSSAWLFNAIANKHADAMDNFPQPNILPRAKDDVEEAKRLSAVVPCILERTQFEQTYSNNWWDKLKHGTAVYFTGYNTELENGLGDVDITSVDLLNIFWQPAISDIQDSRNLFIVALQDNDLLDDSYPQFAGTFGAQTIDVAKYNYDDTVDTTGKSLVVDWYYKRKTDTGATVVQYVKFSGENLLFASENQQGDDGTYTYAERGWYDHGLYPVDFDVMYPEKGTPVGFGMVALAKSPQLYIDKLGANILESSMAGSKVRYLVHDNCDINEDELRDFNKAVIHCGNSLLDDEHFKQIKLAPLDSIYFNVRQAMIEELKETSANRDVSSGGASSGVTAAAAIAALQEAGNKTSRDMIQQSFRCYTQIVSKVVENIRQFYDEPRQFRITGDGGEEEFSEYSNAGLAGKEETVLGEAMMRQAVFDIRIRPQKRSPYSQMAQNETAKELYNMGFFNPEQAQSALIALSMMDFEGKDDLVRQVRQGQTLLAMLQQSQQVIAQLSGAMMPPMGEPPQGTESGGGGGIGRAVANSQTATMGDYGASLVKGGGL